MKFAGTRASRETLAVACPAESQTVCPTVWRDLWTPLFSSLTGQIGIRERLQCWSVGVFLIFHIKVRPAGSENAVMEGRPSS